MIITLKVELDNEGELRRVAGIAFARDLFEVFWKSKHTVFLKELSIDGESVYDAVKSLYAVLEPEASGTRDDDLSSPQVLSSSPE
jgi:hypothetical protein